MKQFAVATVVWQVAYPFAAKLLEPAVRLVMTLN